MGEAKRDYEFQFAAAMRRTCSTVADGARDLTLSTLRRAVLIEKWKLVARRVQRTPDDLSGVVDGLCGASRAAERSQIGHNSVGVSEGMSQAGILQARISDDVAVIRNRGGKDSRAAQRSNVDY